MGIGAIMLWAGALCAAPCGIAAEDGEDGIAAPLQRIRSAPDSFPPELLDEVAAAGSEEALRELIALRRQLTEVSRLEALTSSLARFADTAVAKRAADHLVEVLEDDPPEQICTAACRTLARFEGGAERLRELQQDARSCFVALASLHALLELPAEAEAAWVHELASGAMTPWLRRLGLPGHPGWEAYHASLRCAAMRLRFGQAGGKALLESLVRDPDARVQACALELLAGARSPAAVERATAILLEPLPERVPGTLALRAVDVLRADGRPEAIQALWLAARRDGETRAYALRALRTLPAEPVRVLLLPVLSRKAPPEEVLLALEVLAGHPDAQVLAAVRQLLDHPLRLVRTAAIADLAERQDGESLPRLLVLARRGDIDVRAEAVRAVTRLQAAAPPWREELRELADHAPLDLRIAALEALGFVADPQARELLHRCLGEPDWRVRSAAISALTRMRSPQSVPLLIARLDGERARLRHDLAAALRSITGMPFADWPEDWRQWWADAEPAFVVPPLEQVELADRERRLRASRLRTPGFYGLRVVSDHLTLAIDVSGSMSDPADPQARGGPTRLQVAQREVAQLLQQLEPPSFLNLVFFGAEARRWQPRARELTPLFSAQAEEFAHAQVAGGGTNLYAALAEALRDAEVDTIYLLSDGDPTVGKYVDSIEIRQEARRLNPGRKVVLHTIAIGQPSELLRALAADTGGEHSER